MKEGIYLESIPLKGSRDAAINSYENGKPFYLTYQGTAYETNNIDEYERALSKNFEGLNGYPVPDKQGKPIDASVGKKKVKSSRTRTNKPNYNLSRQQGQELIGLMNQIQGSAQGGQQKFQPDESMIDNSGRDVSRFDDMLTDQAPRLDEQAPIVDQPPMDQPTQEVPPQQLQQEVPPRQVQQEETPIDQRPLNDKLNELIKLAETKQMINDADQSGDISGDAFFHDVLRGNYITSTGGQGQAAPKAGSYPAFQPQKRDNSAMTMYGMALKEKAMDDAALTRALLRDLNERKLVAKTERYNQDRELKQDIASNKIDFRKDKLAKKTALGYVKEDGRLVRSTNKNTTAMDIANIKDLGGDRRQDKDLAHKKWDTTTKEGGKNNRQTISILNKERLNKENNKTKLAIQKLKNSNKLTVTELNNIAKGANVADRLNLDALIFGVKDKTKRYGIDANIIARKKNKLLDILYKKEKDIAVELSKEQDRINSRRNTDANISARGDVAGKNRTSREGIKARELKYKYHKTKVGNVLRSKEFLSRDNIEKLKLIHNTASLAQRKEMGNLTLKAAKEKYLAESAFKKTKLKSLEKYQNDNKLLKLNMYKLKQNGQLLQARRLEKDIKASDERIANAKVKLGYSKIRLANYDKWLEVYKNKNMSFVEKLEAYEAMKKREKANK